MIREAAPTGKRGRQPDDRHAAIHTRLTMAVLSGMALRQTTGFVESLLRLIGLGLAGPRPQQSSARISPLRSNYMATMEWSHRRSRF